MEWSSKLELKQKYNWRLFGFQWYNSITQETWLKLLNAGISMKKKLSCMRTGLDLQASIKVLSLSSALAVAAISYAVTVLDRIHCPGKPSQSCLSKAALNLHFCWYYSSSPTVFFQAAHGPLKFLSFAKRDSSDKVMCACVYRYLYIYNIYIFILHIYIYIEITCRSLLI